MNKVFNVGLVGCGHISETYFRAQKYFNNIKIIKCADLNNKAADNCAKEYGIDSVSLDDIFKDKDIEIILNLTIPKSHYEKKEKALGYLEGMFSFIFFDSEKNEIILARDQFGIKPLYYSFDKGDLIFSSEIKPILMYEKKITLDKENTFEFFLKGSMDHFDKTFFHNIYLNKNK